MLQPPTSLFCWRFCHNKTPTSLWVERIGIPIASTCPFCLKNEESLQHLFFLCPITSKTWKWFCEIGTSTLARCCSPTFGEHLPLQVARLPLSFLKLWWLFFFMLFGELETTSFTRIYLSPWLFFVISFWMRPLYVSVELRSPSVAGFWQVSLTFWIYPSPGVPGRGLRDYPFICSGLLWFFLSVVP